MSIEGNIIGSLHINESLQYTGGAEGYILNLAQTMIHRQIPVQLITGRDEKIDNPSYTNFLPQVDERTSPEQMAFNMSQIRRIMMDNGLDVVHLHNVDSPALLQELIADFPVIRTVIDSRSVCPTEFRINRLGEICTIPIGDDCIDCSNYRITREDLDKKQESLRSLTALDLLITPSLYTKEQLVLNGLSPSKITVLPLFIPTSSDNFIDQDELYASDILFIGRIIKSKGLREAMKAFALIGGTHRFVICGDGPDLVACQEMAHQLGISDRVEYMGWVKDDDRSKYLANTKVVVFPSTGPESFGLVGLEAMYYKKPIVGFNSGGVREWLKDSRNGFLVPTGDVDSLAYHVNILLNDSELREQMGSEGKLLVDTEFSVEHHLNRLLKIYSSVRQNHL